MEYGLHGAGLCSLCIPEAGRVGGQRHKQRDLIIHSKTQEEHLALLDAVFTRMAAHNLRANLKKCVLGSSKTSYLGFRLTKEGIFPGSDKLKAVKEAKPPENVKQIQQFLGLCNFF